MNKKIRISFEGACVGAKFVHERWKNFQIGYSHVQEGEARSVSHNKKLQPTVINNHCVD